MENAMRKHGRMTAWMLTAALLVSQISMQTFAQEDQLTQEVSYEIQETSSELQEVSGETAEALGEVWEVPDETSEASDDMAEITDKTQGVPGETLEASDENPETSDEIQRASGETQEAPDERPETSDETQEVSKEKSEAPDADATAWDTGDWNGTVSGGDIPPYELEETSESDEASASLQVMTADGSVEVTRLEWLKALIEVFEMSVEEDNYPDNYYSDIDAGSADYHDIMLATEFGLVDVEAGEPLRPDEAATREFAAHTLNLCLGYLPDEQMAYTFSEASAVTYPDDIQIAINKGWLGLSGSSFLPEQGITVAEKDLMIAAAREVIASTVIQPGAGSQYQLAAGVIVIPEGTEAALTDDNEITLYDCSVKVAPGNIFVVVSGGFPIARRAVAVNVVDNMTVITVENVELEEAFTGLETQGSMEADLTQVQAIGDDVQLTYIVGGTQEKNYEDGVAYYSLREVQDKEVTAVIATKTVEPADSMGRALSIGGDVLKVSCTISKPNIDWNVSLGSRSGYINLSADITVSVNVDPGTLYEFDFDQPFVKVPIGLYGYFYPSVEGGVSGKVSTCLKGNFSIIVQYSPKAGFRLSGGFNKKSFTIQTMAEVKVGTKVAAGIDVGVIKGELYAKAGVKGYIKRTEYTDSQLPSACTHMAAHLYALLGGSVKIRFLTYKAEYNRDLTIFDEKNSPVKVALHYEDGKPVEVCNRDSGTGSAGGNFGGGGGGGRIYKYYTPINSQYAYSGLNSGTSSTGEPFVIFEYSLNEENQATITKYNGNVAALSIPETIDGYTVVGIGSAVFKDNKRIQMVIIPDTVTEIGEGAFEGCSNLSDVILSKHLETLKARAFGNCDSLTGITIPKSLKYSSWSAYGAGVFKGSDNLRDITFEEGATKIPSYLFANSSIEKIIIPDTVTVIESNAFEYCSFLKEIRLGTGLTSIGGDAFKNAKGVVSIQIPDTVTEIGEGAFEGCSILSDVILSKNLETLKARAFGDCDSLKSITIPKSIKYSSWSAYGAGVFKGSDNLKDITFEEGVTKIPGYMFANSSMEKITIPDTVTTIESNAFEYCSYLKEIQLGSGLTFIGGGAFKNIKGVVSIQIPNTVTEIGEGAFEGCSNLSDVILSKNLETLKARAFGDCDSLKSITIPKSLKYSSWSAYGAGVFKGSDNLKDITFEEGVTKIPGYMFANSSIEKLIIPGTVTVIESNAFENCNDLKEIDIPDSVTSMGNYAFAGCSSLTTVKLPGTQNTIVQGMFQNCTSLSSIELPESVTAIRSYAFQNSGLAEITLPENVQKIEERAFQNCDSLVSVTIPDGVTTLETYCFADCELLKDVQLGTGLTKISAYTFNLCPSLEKIVLPYRMNTVESNAFTNCTKLKELTIPRAVKSIGSNAFSYTTRMTVYGVPGTYAQEWADSVGAAFVSQEKPATAVTLSESTVTVNRGSTITLVLSITPGDFTDEVTWKSSNTSVATVSDTGVVTARGLGDAVIQVNAGNVSASCKVAVLQPVTSIYLNKTGLSMDAADVYALTATVYPNNANDKSISWSSSDESIATVDAGGKVTALRKGTATITATAGDGSNVSGSCKITVANTLYRCETVEALESSHNYENSSSDIWVYALPGAKKIAVTFDERTEIEDGFDFLLLYDASGTEIGKYTGKELAGQIITISGDTVKIRLVSDQSGNTWGFKVSKVEKKDGAADRGVAGKIKCFGQENSPVTVQLLHADGTVAAQTTLTNAGSYALESVESGTYTLRVSRLNYVPRDYTVTLGNEAVTLDAELRLLGDVKGDGKIDAMDKKVLYNHIANPVLTEYDFAVGDVNGDGIIDAKDKKILFNHIAGTTSLWK